MFVFLFLCIYTNPATGCYMNKTILLYLVVYNSGPIQKLSRICMVYRTAPSWVAWWPSGWRGGRVVSAFDSCSKDTGSNPAGAGHYVTTVGKLFTPTVPSRAEGRLNQLAPGTAVPL